MPSTLPMSRSRARTVASTTSTTRLCFSSTTPVSTVKPNPKMPTRMSTAPMLATRKRLRVGVGWVGDGDLRAPAAARSAGVDVRVGQDGGAPQLDDGAAHEVREHCVGLLLEAHAARPGEVGGHLDDRLDLARRESPAGRLASVELRDQELLPSACARAARAAARPAGAGLGCPTLRVSSSSNRIRGGRTSR